MVVFALLGALELRGRGGECAGIPRRRSRELLGMLLARAGDTIGTDMIVDELWGASPPQSARANLHSHVHGLRAALAAAAPHCGSRLWTAPHGYRLEVAPGETDADVFTALAAAGRRALAEGRAADAAERLTRALRLWRGDVLSGMEDYDWHGPYAARLEHARLTAWEEQSEARLLLGRHDELARDLVAVTARHPLQERLWGQYMLALYRAGRRAEALLAYRNLCVGLRTELGAAPRAELRSLYCHIREATAAARSSAWRLRWS
jgi:DNA-binding SARP family transcriptional activator